VKEELENIDVVLVALESRVDLGKQDKQPFFSKSKIIWEGPLSASKGTVVR